MRHTYLQRPGATALVTGASSGIGAATAELLAGQGFRLAVNATGGAALEELARRTDAVCCPADLTAPGAALRLHAAAETTIGTPGLLVCNAGVGWQGPLTGMPVERVEGVLRLNLEAVVQLVRVFAPAMARTGGGHIVLVSSIAGEMGVPGEAVYSASKAALGVFGQSVRLELARDRIGVTVVHPGVVDTGFFARRGSPYHRRRPRPIPAERVATALLAAARRDRPEVFVPAWLRLPARLQGAAPGLVGALRRRLG